MAKYSFAFKKTGMRNRTKKVSSNFSYGTCRNEYRRT